MKTYSEVETEEMEAEFNAAHDYNRERFAGEDGSPEFIRSEYKSYLAEMAEFADEDPLPPTPVKVKVVVHSDCPF